MKKFQTEQETITRTRDKLIEMRCDLCGVLARKWATGDSNDDWTMGGYEIAETSVYLREGSSYPDCGNDEMVYYDICPKCFREKLMPWLKENGAEPRIEESDW